MLILGLVLRCRRLLIVAAVFTAETTGTSASSPRHRGRRAHPLPARARRRRRDPVGLHDHQVRRPPVAAQRREHNKLNELSEKLDKVEAERRRDTTTTRTRRPRRTSAEREASGSAGPARARASAVRSAAWPSHRGPATSTVTSTSWPVEHARPELGAVGRGHRAAAVAHGSRPRASADAPARAARSAADWAARCARTIAATTPERRAEQQQHGEAGDREDGGRAALVPAVTAPHPGALSSATATASALTSTPGRNANSPPGPVTWPDAVATTCPSVVVTATRAPSGATR